MEMNKENTFLVAVEELKEVAKLQNYILTQDQIDEFANEMELDEGQLKLVYEYLKANKIGINEGVDLNEYLSKEDISYLDIYLEELETLESVTEGIKKAITLSAMANDNSAKGKLIELYLKEVVEIAKLYAGQGADLEDLIGEGNVALIMGVELLGCLERPEEVEGMLGKLIMDAMDIYIDEIGKEKEADQKVLDLVNKVAEASEELAQSIGRKVTVPELIREHDLKAEDILEAIRISGQNMEYIEEHKNGDA